MPLFSSSCPRAPAAALRCVIVSATVIVPVPRDAAAQQPLAPDVVFYNGKIATVDRNFSIVEAVAARDGRIVATGSNSAVRRLADEGTRLVDFQGRTVLPGFYDNHAHIGTGRDPRVQDWSHIGSVEELTRALRERAAEVPEGDWILAGLSTEKLPEQELPRKWDLDRVVPDHPVALERMHVMIVNSLALEKAGITKNSPDPRGGVIERAENGEPVGLLRETPAQRLIERVIPDWEPDDETARRAVRGRLMHLLSLGITSVNIPGMRPNTLRFLQDAYDRWGDELPRATVQVRISPGYDTYDDLEVGIQREIELIEGLRFHTGFGDERLKLGAIKMSVDGGMTGQAAWLGDAYKGRPGYHGVVRIPEGALYRVAKRAHELGWQLGIHAIGDAAVRSTVDVYERILSEAPREDHRHYIHHIEVMPPEETLRKMADLGIIAAMQPNFTYSLAPYYRSAMDLESQKIEAVNPQKSLLERGISMSFGSDGLPTGPLVGLYAAVTRRGVDGEVYGPEERIRIQDAIRFYTLGSAYMTFDEDDRGTLEPGKFADMVVLSGDILAIDPERIMDLRVLTTIIGGEVVHRAEPAAASR